MFLLGGLVLGSLLLMIHPSGRTLLFPPLSAHRPGHNLGKIILGTFVACVAGFVAVLEALASADVRSDHDEIGFYAALFAVWLVLSVVAFEYLGISFRDDVAARRNSAAAATICGLMTGETFCLAGANTGNGPGPEVVVICGVLATATLFLLWFLLNAFSGIVDLVCIDRDIGSGIRSTGFLSGGGAILGASIAGDWVSLEQTMRDFVRFCWPILVLLLLAIFVERVSANRRLNGRSTIYFSSAYSGIIFSLCVIYAVRMWSRG